VTRAEAEALDARDPLAPFRERFVIADPGAIYLDGNSLGRLPKGTRDRLHRVVDEWGEQLVGGWHDWIEAPTRTGDALAEEVVHHAVGQAQRARQLEIEHAGLGDDRGDRHARIVAGRGPRREVAAGGMADRHDAAEVDAVERGQVVDGGGDVVERLRNAAAAAEPAVLDVPGRPAAPREVLAQRVHQGQVVAVAPEAAVEHDGDRPRPVQDAELRGVVAVPTPPAPHGRAGASRPIEPGLG
jgi:hypothetical protein